MSNQKTILTFGAHRSGTSLTANILNHIGVNLGTNLMQADVDNPEGYYENWDFVQMNNKILSNAGGHWNYPPPLEEILEQREILKDEVKKLIEKNESELWGWKDNRTMFTFPVYEPYLITRNLHIIITYRKREDTISSLMHPSFLEMFRQEDRNREYVGWLVDEHYRRLEEATGSKYPILKVQFEDFFEGDSFNDEICKILKFIFGKVENELLVKAKTVINPKIKHL
jgi:hypothetical protein